MLILVAGLLVSMLYSPPAIEAQRIVIRDSEGRRRAVLTSFAGQTSMKFLDEEGWIVMHLASGKSASYLSMGHRGRNRPTGELRIPHRRGVPGLRLCNEARECLRVEPTGTAVR